MVVFLDACYSARRGADFSSSARRASHPGRPVPRAADALEGARHHQRPHAPRRCRIELPELGHGIFTYYLVEGLKGARPQKKDGIVTVQELYEYLEQQVAKKSRSVGATSTPS